MRQPIQTLLETFKKGKQPNNPYTPKFYGVDGFDVYNPSNLFEYKGKTLIIARVEKRDSEVSKAVYFEKRGNDFYLRDDIPTLDLQDPFISVIDNDYVVGGTYVYHDNRRTRWYTKFYKGPDLDNLKPSLDSPDGMKDVRLIQLKDKRIGVFTRPQGLKGKRGEIGFDIAPSYAHIDKEFIENAPLFEQFVESDWGGANQLMMLDDQTIGVLGHIATFSTGNVRHYYSMTFKVDVTTKKASPMKLIAQRSNFNPGPAKRIDLVDVLFSGGLVPVNNDKYILYVGVSDAEIQTIEIEKPFDIK